MMQDINKIAIVTASSKGLGFALAKSFSKANYGIILHGRSEEKLSEASKSLQNVVDIVQGDLLDNSTIERIYELASKHKTNLLINNAAIPCYGLPLSSMSENQIRTSLMTNLVSPILLTHRLYEVIKENGPGGIININSIVGIEPKPNRSVHSASKWGLKGFCKSLRIEAARDKIKVMSVYPTRIMTQADYEYGLDPEYVAELICEKFHSEDSNLDLVVDGRPPEYRGNYTP